MRFEDIKEQIIEALKFYWEKTRESSIYIQLEEKYEELNPRVQKLLKYTSVFMIVYFVLSFPLGWMSQASLNLERYQTNRNLIENLLNVQAEMQQAPDINVNISPAQLKQQADDVVSKSGLSDEQVQASKTLTSAERSFNFIPKEVRFVGVELKLNKLNVNQVLDIGTKLQNMNRSAKLIELDMQANKDDNHYYDVTFLVASFTGSANNE